MAIADKVSSKKRAGLKPPPYYQVLLHNDDFTTMDFVIDVLQRFFSLSIEQAETVMLKIHHEGRAVCGVYTLDIAQTKVSLVMEYAEHNEFPLQCSYEPTQ